LSFASRGNAAADFCAEQMRHPTSNCYRDLQAKCPQTDISFGESFLFLKDRVYDRVVCDDARNVLTRACDVLNFSQFVDSHSQGRFADVHVKEMYNELLKEKNSLKLRLYLLLITNSICFVRKHDDDVIDNVDKKDAFFVHELCDVCKCHVSLEHLLVECPRFASARHALFMKLIQILQSIFSDFDYASFSCHHIFNLLLYILYPLQKQYSFNYFYSTSSSLSSYSSSSSSSFSYSSSSSLTSSSSSSSDGVFPLLPTVLTTLSATAQVRSKCSTLHALYPCNVVLRWLIGGFSLSEFVQAMNNLGLKQNVSVHDLHNFAHQFRLLLFDFACDCCKKVFIHRLFLKF